MRILEQGKYPEDKYECRCGKCSTLFEFIKSEAEYIHDQRDGDCLKINCPVCSDTHWISVKLGKRK